MAHYASCPTCLVNAPAGLVWHLLTNPEQWDDFYDLRVLSVRPAGPAAIGQTVFAESGPRLLHLKVELQFTAIDPLAYSLGLGVRLPFGLTVSENLACIPLTESQCRVSYHCDFQFPRGARGRLLHTLLRRQLDTGPEDSLARLKQAAEKLHASSLNP